ncbi:hypothetical protein B0619_07920 [Campylobacter lari]|nr:hypothetical protein [Campylobacter lari]EAK5787117.1 hypothetical protein [Campylobacter lari]
MDILELDFRIYDYELDKFYNQKDIIIKWDKKNNKQSIFYKDKLLEKCEIQFYSGIKDINGNKIYEGDSLISFDEQEDFKDKIINKVIYSNFDSFILSNNKSLDDYLNHLIVKDFEK